METISINIKEWEEKRLPYIYQDKKIVFDDEAQNTIQSLHKKNIIEIYELKDELLIKTFSYVGSLKIGNLQINITPKIDSMPLFNLLKYAYSFKDIQSLTNVKLAKKDNLFQDILIYQLLLEAETLLTRGLKRNYINENDDLQYLRGRINFKKIVNRSGVITNTLPCNFFSLSRNILINQVLLSGLLLSQRVVNDKILSIRIQQLSKYLLNEISPVPLSYSVFIQVFNQMNRLFKAYESSLYLIKLLYDSQAISLEEENQEISLNGFLFDMNRFFQRLISKYLKENISGYKIIDEYSLKNVMAYQSEKNPKNKKRPIPRPDFVLCDSNNKIIAILDAKYRDLWERSLPRDMLYQLALYSLLGSKDTKKSIIIYPTLSTNAEEQGIDIFEPLNGNYMGEVLLRPLNLLKLESLILNNDRKEKQQYADYLAFG